MMTPFERFSRSDIPMSESFATPSLTFELQKARFYFVYTLSTFTLLHACPVHATKLPSAFLIRFFCELKYRVTMKKV